MGNKLIIFDFDGVLVKTEETTFNFYRELLPRYGITLTREHFKLKIGRKSVDFFKDIFKEDYDEGIINNLIEQKRIAFLTNIKKYLEPNPGIYQLLEDCRKAGLTLAVGSQNERDLIEKAMDVFDFRKYFSVITAIQDLKNKKPHPEVFLLISNKLGIPSNEAVVIEDAPVGIEAAKAGGFKSIGITSSFSKEDLKKADMVISDLNQLNPSLLKGL